MAKVVNTKLVLGSRTVGFEFLELETGEIIGLSEKDIKDMLVAGEEKLYGFHLDSEGKSAVLDENVNLVKKAGISSVSTVKPLNGMVSEIFSLIGKDDINKSYTVINSRWGRKELTQSKLRALLELGAVINGVSMDKDNNITTWFDDANEAMPVKQDEPAKTDKKNK